MTKLEQRLRENLKTVPGPGFTPQLQAEVLTRVQNVRNMSRKRKMPVAWASVLSSAAAVAVVAVGGWIYHQHQIAGETPMSVGAGGDTYNIGRTSTSFQAAASLLLGKYGWHPNYAKQAVQKLKLPITFADAPGAYPLGLYWAYHSVLSKAIGLNIADHLGQPAEVHIIPVQQWKTGIPAYDENRTTYAIVVTAQDRIVGAWISQGLNLSDYAMSLSRKFFTQLSHQTWDQWMQTEGIVNYRQGVDEKRKSMTPEQVIRAYFAAIDNKQYQLACSYMTKDAQYAEMTMNLPDGMLYNSSFHTTKYDMMYNITSVRVTKITLHDLPPFQGNQSDPTMQREDRLQYNLFNRKTYAQHEYEVDVVEKYKQEITRNSGPQGWFVGVVKESPNAPWKISGYGSGP